MHRVHPIALLVFTLALFAMPAGVAHAQGEVIDLAIAEAGLLDLSDGQVRAVAVVINEGDLPTDDTEICLYPATQPELRTCQLVEPLEPGQGAEIVLTLQFGPGLAYRQTPYIIALDPDNQIGDSNRRNNTFEIPAPAEEARGPDLAIVEVGIGEPSVGSVRVPLFALVENLGDATSERTLLCAGTSAAATLSDCVRVDALRPGTAQEVTLTLVLDDSWQGERTAFRFELDAERSTPDADRSNNTAQTERITLPGRAATPLPPLLILLVASVGGLTLLALGSTPFVLRGVRRRRWQKQAQPEKPPDGGCTGTQRYVEVETEISLRGMKATTLTITTKADASGEPLHRVTLKRRLPRALGEVIRLYRAQHDTLSRHVRALAEDMAAEVFKVVLHAAERQDVTLDAHFEGIETEHTYTPYRCVRGQWKPGRSWQVSTTQQRDDRVFHMRPVDPTAITKEGIAADLEADLYRYLQHHFGQSQPTRPVETLPMP